jgi:hypothetical protein
LLIIACLAAYQLNKQFLPPYLKFLQYLLLVALIFEIADEILTHYEINTHFLDHLYQPIELTLLSILYVFAVDQDSFRKALRVILPSTVVMMLIWSFKVEGILNANTGSFLLGSIVITVYAIVYKYRLFTSPPTKESLLVNPFFWINTANLFFYCGTFFQMGLHDYIRKSNPVLADELFVINHGLNYVLHILYLTGFLCKRIFILYSSL